MPCLGHNYTQLPRKLQQELSILQEDLGGSRCSRVKAPNRKQVRKKAREQKKSRQTQHRRATGLALLESKVDEVSHHHVQSISNRSPSGFQAATKQRLQPTLKQVKGKPNLERSPSPAAEVLRNVRKKIDEDSAAIENLEGKLGLRGKSKLSKAFENDGLDVLLEGLDDVDAASSQQKGKRKRSQEEEWLEAKRKKLHNIDLDEGPWEDEDLIEGSESVGSTDGIKGDVDEDWNPLPSNGESEDEANPSPAVSKSSTKTRENPYRPPMPIGSGAVTERYVPPSLRKKALEAPEDSSHIQKKLKGSLNRLSAANLISIVREVEDIYQRQARQLVSTCLIRIMTETLADPATLQDTFLILHSGFIAALYKVLGTDFGACVVESLFAEFKRQYENMTSESASNAEATNKKILNLVQVLAELYNFQVIASNLIYDIVHSLLKKFSEANTEILLRLLRSCGPELRQDDPSSLRAISLQLQDRAHQPGAGQTSVRMRFMVETIDELHKKGAKSQAAFSAISTEHRNSMKKTLGSLSQRNNKASEPLRFGLADLENMNRRGKWWLVGSSFTDVNSTDLAPIEKSSSVLDDSNGRPRSRSSSIDSDILDTSPAIIPDLAQIAKQQRLNTDVRRSIFVAIMSASDYADAHTRLKKLHLKKSQELEIPKVLIHCNCVEGTYNPFYTLLARRFCGEHKLRMAFRFGLWDVFRRLSEGVDGDDRDEVEDDHRGDADVDGDESRGSGVLSLRALVNLGKMFGTLIAEDGLSLGVLKTLNLFSLKSKARTLIEILLVTLILQVDGKEARLIELCARTKEMSDMASGLQFFLKVVKMSDLVGGERERKIVKRACKVINQTLARLADAAS